MAAIKRSGPSADDSGIPIRWLIIAGSVLTIAAICFAGWFLLVRDTWEQVHAIRLHQMSMDVLTLADAGKDNEALAKSDELKSVVGDRSLKHSELNAAVSRAIERSATIADKLESRRLAERNQRTIEATRQSVLALENTGRQREQLGNWEPALDAYREALATIRQRGPTDQVFIDDSRRLAQAIERVEAALANQKQREQEAADRVARAAKLASIRATIRGGAWITRKGGSSDVLRGLEVLAASRWVDAAHTIEFHDATIAAMSAKLDEYKATLSEQEASQYEPLIWRTKELIALTESLLKTYRESRALATAGTPTDLRALALRLPEEPSAEEEAAFLRLIAKNLRGSTHADIDGKYQLVVPGGESCIIAMFASENSRIFWCEVVDVAGEGEHSLDLRNSNAMSIWNKSR